MYFCTPETTISIYQYSPRHISTTCIISTGARAWAIGPEKCLLTHKTRRNRRRHAIMDSYCEKIFSHLGHIQGNLLNFKLSDRICV